VEVGTNTSTIALRILEEARKRELCAWGYNLATLFLGDKYRDLALQVRGVLNLR
jgi:hypothetical protein